MPHTANPYKEFNALTVGLDGSNLIEASAGTGKTYSIAILVLRLVLEHRLPIKEILMVTFTKAAVAELEERIRLFIRMAYKRSHGSAIKDANIDMLVEQAIDRSSQAEVQQCLRDAILFLDETSVLTIHSFCQNTLTEFAFETSQLFGAKMLADIAPVIAEELNKFWRTYVTTMPEELLTIIGSGRDIRSGISKAMAEHLSGKKYSGFKEGTTYSVSPSDCTDCLKMHRVSKQEAQALLEALHQRIIAEKAELEAKCQKGHAKNHLAHLIDSPVDFLNAIKTKRSSKYVSEGFAELLTALDECDEKTGSCDEIIQELLTRLYCFAIQEVAKGVLQFKLRNNLMSYDDMIGNLHAALVKRENPALIAALRKKYKAVFVDEFQDTDRQQYEIFNTAFGTDTILFYIGDPKQSIYAWRKADIFTYFKARSGVRHLYGMNRNFRSTEPMIRAMNRFFLPVPGFDTFHFDSSPEAIQYIAVESPEPNAKRLCYKRAETEPPISIFRCGNKEELIDAVANQVASLLEPGSYATGSPERGAPVNPSDIGILVRTGSQGRSVKAALAERGIPAITIDESKVLQSDEAKSLLHVLEAMSKPDRSTINRALLSPFTKLTVADILRIDDEAALDRFMSYREIWQQDGLYNATMKYVADLEIQETLLVSDTNSGERLLTNLYQITELLHSVQTRKNLSEVELISWLRRAIEGASTEGDEYEQRVENDEQAVKIVTIHKSKGLEYKIVLAPFLDFVPAKKNQHINFFSYRDPETTDYIGVEKSRMTPEVLLLQEAQEEQENRRLLYVAVTRAIYKCYLFRCESGYYSGSTLSKFVSSVSPDEPELIRFENGLPQAPAVEYKLSVSRIPAAVLTAKQFKLQQGSWHKMSFTMLTAKGSKAPYARGPKGDNLYDNFIFHELTRGKKSGELLHYIFERINFSNNSRWEAVISDALSRFAPARKPTWLPLLQEMLQHVLHTVISINGAAFPLAATAWNKRIPEFEFDFPVAPFLTDTLQAISDETAPVRIRYAESGNGYPLEGIMNGKMDLFFEYGNKYYILDWKSNFLGASPADYHAEAMKEVMDEEGYHLQYLIYSLAAKKFLEHRLQQKFDYDRDFGGVIYLFVRGMRTGSDTGIFTCKPSVEKIGRLQEVLKDYPRDPATIAAEHSITLAYPVAVGDLIVNE